MTQVLILVNAVERVSWYADRSCLPQEDHHSSFEPEKTWPATGRVSFENVEMAYRPGLPAVLKGMWVIGKERADNTERLQRLREKRSEL